MKQRYLFLALAVLAALSMVFVGTAIAIGKGSLIFISLIVWCSIMGIGFSLKRKWKMVE